MNARLLEKLYYKMRDKSAAPLPLPLADYLAPLMENFSANSRESHARSWLFLAARSNALVKASWWLCLNCYCYWLLERWHRTEASLRADLKIALLWVSTCPFWFLKVLWKRQITVNFNVCRTWSAKWLFLWLLIKENVTCICALTKLSVVVIHDFCFTYINPLDRGWQEDLIFW